VHVATLAPVARVEVGAVAERDLGVRAQGAYKVDVGALCSIWAELACRRGADGDERAQEGELRASEVKSAVSRPGERPVVESSGGARRVRSDGAPSPSLPCARSCRSREVRAVREARHPPTLARSFDGCSRRRSDGSGLRYTQYRRVRG